MSEVSTVAPHQTRSPGGASRWAPISKATPSSSRLEAMPLGTRATASAPRALPLGSGTARKTLVLERVAGSLARWVTQGVLATHSDSAAALALARANNASRPPIDFAQLSVSR